MPTYEVLVTRYYSQTATVEVDAENEDEARNIAAESPDDDLEFDWDGFEYPIETEILESYGFEE